MRSCSLEIVYALRQKLPSGMGLSFPRGKPHPYSTHCPRRDGGRRGCWRQCGFLVGRSPRHRDWRNPGRGTHARAACPSYFGACQHASGNARERAGCDPESIHGAFSGRRLQATHSGDRTQHQFDGTAASGDDANRQCSARNRSGAGAKQGNQEAPLCIALRVAQRTTASAWASFTIETYGDRRRGYY